MKVNNSETNLLVLLRAVFGIIAVLGISLLMFIFGISKLTKEVFTSANNLYLVEMILFAFSLIELAVIIIWPLIFRYKRLKTNSVLSAQIIRIFIVGAIVGNGFVLNLLGSTGFIRLIIIIMALIMLAIFYPGINNFYSYHKNIIKKVNVNSAK